MRQKKVPIFSASACGYNALIFCKVIKTKVDDFKRTLKIINSVKTKCYFLKRRKNKKTLRINDLNLTYGVRYD